MVALSILKKIFGAVPWWVWLVVVAVSWGAWQRHQVKSIEGKRTKEIVQAAADRETKLIADAQETARRLQTQKGIANAAQIKSKKDAADAAVARAAADELRARLAAIAANAGSGDPSAPNGGAAAQAGVGMLADVLGKCTQRVQRLAEIADASRTAGAACEEAYDSLTAKKFRAE